MLQKCYGNATAVLRALVIGKGIPLVYPWRSLAMAVLQLSYGCPTAVLWLYYSCPTAVLQLSYGCTTAVLRLYYSCPTAVLQLSYGCPTAVLRLYYSCPTALQPTGHYASLSVYSDYCDYRFCGNITWFADVSANCIYLDSMGGCSDYIVEV
jgi:hypothetical protein